MSKDAYAALRYKDFRYFVFTQFTYTSAVLIQEVVLGFYLYKVTGDKLALGILGLLEAIPYLILALVGGHIADRFDKKKVAMVCTMAMGVISTLLILGLLGTNDVSKIKSIIYTTVFSIGVCRGFMSPAWSSIKPFLVREEHFTNAAAWSSQFWQAGMLIGPMISGFLFAYLGLKTTLIIVVILFLLCFSAISLIGSNTRATSTSSQNFIASLKEGFAFVSKTKILLYAIALDMFSVLFGGVIAILPVFANDILHIGAEGLGIMRAAPGVGAVLTMLVMTHYPPTNQAWRNLLLAIAGFGIATLVFAFSKNYILSCIALFFTGAFDSVSVVIRQTILNLLPPVEMRGRVSAINGVFVSCSNELGAFESGVAAQLMGTVSSVVFGAGMTLLIIGYVALKTRDLLHVSLKR